MTNWEKENNKLDKLHIAPFELSSQHFKDLKKSCAKAKKKQYDYNHHLAGHITEEYKIDPQPQEVTQYLLSVTNHEIFNHYKEKTVILNKNCPYYMDSLWCNYQKKHEFNPIHTHSGLYSFVIFLKIPYDLKKEDKYYRKLSESDRKESQVVTSRFSFINLDPIDGIVCTSINVDKSFEGKGYMFNSKQLHMVYPFYTSDQYRITVSGNIKFNTG
jgi:hypothetical protein|tara:strand:- start:696 stop:1340 length:645 start_codon:yes stop_codon:yes gene_type:complete